MSLLSNVFARCLACCVLAGCSPSENIDTKNSAEVPLTVQQREKVDSLLASMTVQQKVAQMIQHDNQVLLKRIQNAQATLNSAELDRHAAEHQKFFFVLHTYEIYILFLMLHLLNLKR